MKQPIKITQLINALYRQSVRIEKLWTHDVHGVKWTEEWHRRG